MSGKARCLLIVGALGQRLDLDGVDVLDARQLFAQLLAASLGALHPAARLFEALLAGLLVGAQRVDDFLALIELALHLGLLVAQVGQLSLDREAAIAGLDDLFVARRDLIAKIEQLASFGALLARSSSSRLGHRPSCCSQSAVRSALLARCSAVDARCSACAAR